MKKLTAVILSVLLAAGYAPACRTPPQNTVHAGDRAYYLLDGDIEEGRTDTGLHYLHDAQKAVITGYDGASSDVVVPKEVGGYPVIGLDDFAFSKGHWEQCVPENVRVERVTIEAEIDTIPMYCFDCLAELEEVHMPDSVQSIGLYAFQSCDSLREIRFPANLVNISESAFIRCASLAKIELPEGTQTVDVFAFAECPALEEVLLPDSVTFLGAYAFSACSSLRRCRLSGSLRQIPVRAFSACKSLTEIVLPDSVTEIANAAFSDCEMLTKAEIPASVTSIEYDAFDHCSPYLVLYGEPGSYAEQYAGERRLIFSPIGTDLRFIEDEQGVLYLPQEDNTLSVYLYRGTAQEITIPASLNGQTVSALSPRAFAENTEIRSVTVQAPVTSVPEECFAYSLVTAVSLPDTVRKIEAGAFTHCEYLAEMTVPEGVTELGASALSYCLRMETLSLPDSLRVIGESAFEHCEVLNALHIPQGVTELARGLCVGCYVLADVTLPTTLLHIRENVFPDRKLITDFVIPDGCRSIGHFAYYVNSAQRSVTVPASVTEMDDAAIFGDTDGLILYGESGSAAEAFAKAHQIVFMPIGQEADWITADDGLVYLKTESGLRLSKYAGTAGDVAVPASVDGIPVTAISEEAFAGSRVRRVEIRAAVAEIPARCFYNSAVSEIVLPDSVTAVGDEAFSGCGNLQTLRLPDALTYLGRGAFRNGRKQSPEDGALLSGLREITVPAGVTRILADTFCYTSLEKIHFLGQITEIGSGAFSGTLLTSADLPDSLVSLCGFSDCGSLTGMRIPDSVQVIGRGAFSHSPLSSIRLPESVTDIETAAFAYCSALRCVYIPASVGAIAQDAFAGCNSLVIRAPKDSYAARYAAQRRIPFVEDAETPRYDTDGNGDVGIADAVLLTRFIAEDGTLSHADAACTARTRPDYDGDGLVTAADLKLLLQYLMSAQESVRK